MTFKDGEEYPFQKGDTVFGLEGKYGRNVEIEIIKPPYRIKSTFSNRLLISDSILDPIDIPDTSFHSSLEPIDFVSPENHFKQIRDATIFTYSVFFFISLLVAFFLIRFDSNYKFENDSFSIGKKNFRINTFQGRVIDINRYAKTRVSSKEGSAQIIGNTLHVSMPTLKVNMDYFTEIWMQGKNGREWRIKLPYDNPNTRVGALLSEVWVSGKSFEKRVGLLYHNSKQFTYSIYSILIKPLSNTLKLVSPFKIFLLAILPPILIYFLIMLTNVISLPFQKIISSLDYPEFYK